VQIKIGVASVVEQEDCAFVVRWKRSFELEHFDFEEIPECFRPNAMSPEI
jgi:hypothetical protein